MRRPRHVPRAQHQPVVITGRMIDPVRHPRGGTVSATASARSRSPSVSRTSISSRAGGSLRWDSAWAPAASGFSSCMSARRYTARRGLMRPARATAATATTGRDRAKASSTISNASSHRPAEVSGSTSFCAFSAPSERISQAIWTGHRPAGRPDCPAHDHPGPPGRRCLLDARSACTMRPQPGTPRRLAILICEAGELFIELDRAAPLLSRVVGVRAGGRPCSRPARGPAVFAMGPRQALVAVLYSQGRDGLRSSNPGHSATCAAASLGGVFGVELAEDAVAVGLELAAARFYQPAQRILRTSARTSSSSAGQRPRVAGWGRPCRRCSPGPPSRAHSPVVTDESGGAGRYYP